MSLIVPLMKQDTAGSNLGILIMRSPLRKNYLMGLLRNLEKRSWLRMRLSFSQALTILSRPHLIFYVPTSKNILIIFYLKIVEQVA
ncbi:hypothetical protein SAMN05421825_2774 [Epilithonimonas hungarica]|uniref:Uncharacterized protein n=1 Tax=Epilithonimonas hungarica TaxID=454006 RepID=A0A1G7RTS5_9FLAO|nr:hypothetical protein SAMN05421825_2774 [Epilithonimonas hungarica]